MLSMTLSCCVLCSDIAPGKAGPERRSRPASLRAEAVGHHVAGGVEAGNDRTVGPEHTGSGVGTRPPSYRGKLKLRGVPLINHSQDGFDVSYVVNPVKGFTRPLASLYSRRHGGASCLGPAQVSPGLRFNTSKDTPPAKFPASLGLHLHYSCDPATRWPRIDDEKLEETNRDPTAFQTGARPDRRPSRRLARRRTTRSPASHMILPSLRSRATRCHSPNSGVG